MGKAFFTDAQYQYARYEARALDYALSSGYQLFKDGNCYRMREHDSMVFTSDGRWFWNSRGISGHAIEFAMNYENKTLPEAVLSICEKGGAASAVVSASRPKAHTKAPFLLPPKADNCRRVFAYLCTVRKLDREILAELIKSGDLYESRTEYRKADGQKGEAHNAVFVGRDAEGVPRSAFQRGLSSDAIRPFKMDVAGSDPAAPFCIRGLNADTVAVFEAAIDAISHATIYKLAGLEYKAIDRIAIGGTEKTVGLKCYLAAHPEIKRVYLCFDEDAGGNAAAKRAEAELKDGIFIDRVHQNGGKDWNNYLTFWDRVIQDGVSRRPAKGGAIYIFNSNFRLTDTEIYEEESKYVDAVEWHLLHGDVIVALRNK